MTDWDKSKYQLDIQAQVYKANNMQMRSLLSMLSRTLDQCIWLRPLFQSNEPLSGLVIRLVHL